MVAQRQCINKTEAQSRAQHPRSHTGAKAKFVRRGVTVTQSEGWDGDSVSAAQAGGKRTERSEGSSVRSSGISAGLLMGVHLCMCMCAGGG